MWDNDYFSLIFLSQILLGSALLPYFITRKVRRLMDQHPADRYPRLYPKSRSWYERQYRNINFVHGAALLVGLFFVAVYTFDASNDDYAGVVFGVFMLQSVPYLLLELFTVRNRTLMREADDRRVRTATLHRRSLFTFISPVQLGTLGFVFLGFCAFVGYMHQFDLPWFGGWANVAVIAGGMTFMALLLWWSARFTMRDPYLSEDDRVESVRRLVRQYTIVCVAVTVYAMVTISLKAGDLNALRHVAMSIYFQLLLAAYYFTMIRPDGLNFEVYQPAGPEDEPAIRTS